MISKSTWIHLRIPFSIYLSPVFFFALSQVEYFDITDAILVFVTLHIFLYPASNGFNSYYDRDEGSIGGIEKPPQVDKSLYFVAWVFDFVAIVLAAYLSSAFAIGVFAWGLVSKAYSHPWLRLKKFPLLGWLTVSLFQGAAVYLGVVLALTKVHPWQLLEINYWLPAIISSVLFGGAYPLTQIYQHDEDAKRGDLTLSRLLGIRGTFLFSAFFLVVANALFYIWFESLGSLYYFYILQAFFLPVIIYFNYWFVQCEKDPRNADFAHTMRMNKFSSSVLISYFLLLLFV